MSRILVVEDEQHLAEGLRFNLEAEGYQVRVVDTGEAALEVLRPESPPFDVVILDVMLPGVDGFDVMAEMRHRGQFVPTLMLTARGHPDDVLRGFAAGADDYLAKPFELAILIARISGLLRRREWLRASMNPVTEPLAGPPPETDETFTFGDKSMYFDRLELHVREQVFPLTLMAARGQTGVAEGHAGRGVGPARRYRYAGHRQFHRAAEALYRRRSHAPAAPADRARGGIPVCGGSSGVRLRVAAQFRQKGLLAKGGTGCPEAVFPEPDCGAALFHAHDNSGRDQTQVHVVVQQDGPADT